VGHGDGDKREAELAEVVSEELRHLVGELLLLRVQLQEGLLERGGAEGIRDEGVDLILDDRPHLLLTGCSSGTHGLCGGDDMLHVLG